MSFKTPSTSMRERCASITARGFCRSLREDGAIDLASIMVGVLVMGILGAVIAAAVFAVIPWSQNNAAEGNLDAVKTAQSVQYTMSAGSGTAAFLADENLESAAATVGAGGNSSGKVLIQDNKAVGVWVAVISGESVYRAISVSATGKAYTITSKNPSDAIEHASAAAALTAMTITGSGAYVPATGWPTDTGVFATAP